MAEIIRRALSFGEGANTSETGISAQPAWRMFDEADVSGGGNRRRLGRKRLAQFSTTARIVDFDGTNDVVTFGAMLFSTLPIRFTMEILFATDAIASARNVMGRIGSTSAPIGIIHNTDSTVVVTVIDSAGTTSTLTFTGIAAGTVCALMLVRDGAALTGILNGTTATTTMNATNVLGAGTSCLGTNSLTNFFDGGVDFLRFLSTVETSQRHGWMRLPDPRAENVIADWLIGLDANGYCLDRSRNEFHATSSGSPATTRVPICYNPDPVIGIGTTFDKSGARIGYCVVGDGVYPYTFS